MGMKIFFCLYVANERNVKVIKLILIMAFNIHARKDWNMSHYTEKKIFSNLHAGLLYSEREIRSVGIDLACLAYTCNSNFAAS